MSFGLSSISGALGMSSASLVGGLGTGLLGIGLNAWQNYDNRKATSKANDYNFGMWQAENEYNKPINQMARLSEAGLNPNLVYGGGATTLSARSQGAHEAVQRAPDILGAVGAYQDIKQKDAMTENTKATTATTTAMRPLELKNAAKRADVADAEISNLRQEGANLKKQGMLLQSEIFKRQMEVNRQSMDMAIQEAIFPNALQAAKNESARDASTVMNFLRYGREVAESVEPWVNMGTGIYNATQSGKPRSVVYKNYYR